MNVLSISENILAYISAFGLLQGILLAVVIFYHPKSDRRVNKFLALYIACISIVMSGPLLLKIVGWKNSFGVAPFPALVGPLLFFYIRSFKQAITWVKAFPHLILFVVYLIGSYFFVTYLDKTYPGSADFPQQGFRSPVGLTFFLVRYAQMITYYFLCRRELVSYQQSIQQLYSETSRINLSWVKWLINGYIFIILISLVIYFLTAKYPANFYLLYLLNIAIATPYIYGATYKGITQPTIWQIEKKNIPQQQVAAAETIQQVFEKPQQPKQVIQDNRAEEIISKVMVVMENDKLYQEPELTLQNLSDKLGYPAYQVSLVINEGMKKTFYDLVNSYRVEEAKRLLLDPKSKNYTILSVGFEAGFNSKTTFNTVFKKFTGLTPTEYRDKQKAEPMQAIAKHNFVL